MSIVFAFDTNMEKQVLIIYRLLGEYDSKEILKALEEKISEGFSNFVVDLERVEFMNSVGLNCLIGIHQRLEKAGGKMVITNCSTKVLQLLNMTKLHEIFNLAASVEAGLAILE